MDDKKISEEELKEVTGGVSEHGILSKELPEVMKLGLGGNTGRLIGGLGMVPYLGDVSLISDDDGRARGRDL